MTPCPLPAPMLKKGSILLCFFICDLCCTHKIIISHYDIIIISNCDIVTMGCYHIVILSAHIIFMFD